MAEAPDLWAASILDLSRADFDAGRDGSQFDPERQGIPSEDAQTGSRPLGAPCAYRDDAILDEAGKPALQACESCSGNVRLKLFGCGHPSHAAHPTTTDRECRICPDYFPESEQVGPLVASTDQGGLPVSMVAPSQARPHIWRGGVIQIMVTRACDLSCFGCSQGSNLGGKPAVMTPEQFDAACTSLIGYPGVVGMFGGNPAVHPRFDELCRIMRDRIPWEQRGLWCNNLNGKGQHARITFNPKHSNLNVHLNQDARAEFIRDWPESEPYLKGHDVDSTHGSPWVALKDAIPDEAERWNLIGDCDINKNWSALIGVFRGELRAYFCEIAYSQAAMHENNPNWDDSRRSMPDLGLEVVPGWWRRPMADFEGQARLHCHACGIPLRRPGQLAIGGVKEEFSETHRHIARSKIRGRMVDFVPVESLSRPARPATQYLPGTTPGYID